MATSASKVKDSSALRPSASLVVVNSSNEVLLVHRNPKATSFAGMHVFPGGNYDEKQDESYKMTAIRETFEETGLLLASSTSNNASPTDAAALDASRRSIHAGKSLFRDFLKQNSLSADVRALLPFTEWITPLGTPRRFHTRFYVAFLSSSSSSSLRASESGCFSEGGGDAWPLQRPPTPDGGQEVVQTRFVHPLEALAEHRAEKIALMPPQHYILTTLADILVGRSATAQQRARVERLSGGAFGRMVVFPRAGKKDANGRMPLVYEGDEARGGPKGRLHRSLVLFSPETKLPTEIELLRNFDVFTDIEGDVDIRSTKL